MSGKRRAITVQFQKVGERIQVLVLRIKNVTVILSNLVYSVLWTGEVEAGGHKRRHNKGTDLKPTADLDRVFGASAGRERENSVAVRGGWKVRA